MRASTHNPFEEKEIWKDIRWRYVPGYESYMVSQYGHVKSLDRKDSIGRPRKGKQMRQQIVDGYRKLILTKDGVEKWFFVHRLVAFAFIKNPRNLPIINHKDSDRLNCYYRNLEWCNHSENMLHCLKAGRRTVLRGENSSSAKLKNFQILEIRIKIEEGMTNPDIAKQYGVKHECISKIRRNTRWNHVR